MENRDIGSAIFYMKTKDQFSHRHRLPTDELYHFYMGEPVELLELMPGDSHKITVLGKDLSAEQQLQQAAAGGNRQGSHLSNGEGNAL